MFKYYYIIDKREVLEISGSHAHVYARTHAHINCFMALWILSATTQVSRYQKKHSPTHTYHGHQSCLLPSSIAIHGILPVQITCLTVFFLQSLSKFSLVLVYLLTWHPPLHTPDISSPNHCLLFAAHAQKDCTQ